MTLTNKILIAVGLAALLAAITFIVVKERQLSAQQKAIDTQVVAQKQLADEIVRSQAQYATKQDVETFAKTNGINLNVVRDDLAKLDAKISGVNTVTVNSQAQTNQNVRSDSTVARTDSSPPNMATCHDGTTAPCPDPYGYQTNAQTLNLNENFNSIQIPFGKVDFSAWREKPWDVSIYGRQYHLNTVLAKDNDGRDLVYSKVTINSNGKDYEVKIDDAKLVQEYPAAQFSFWNPRLYLGVSGGVGLQEFRGEFAPSLSLGIMSYGMFKNQPDWVFLSIGAGYAVQSRRPIFMLTPVQYNVGQHIPFTRNIYLGPTVGVDTAGVMYVMGSIGVGL